MCVFIVVKENWNSKPLPYRTNEAVLPTEEEANAYVERRKALKDRDDIKCTFKVEPWYVGIPTVEKPAT